MAMLHSPESVVVFANSDAAKEWIGFERVWPDQPETSDTC
jgi:hypothetical protein